MTEQASVAAASPVHESSILALVHYASPEQWGTTPEEVLLGSFICALNATSAKPVYLLAWPDGVRAMLPSAYRPGSPEMNAAVVSTYRMAACGQLGPVAVGAAL